MAKINCEVDSCVYHAKDDVCQAESIMVKNNPRRVYDMEIGAMAGETRAMTSAETMCQTFKPQPKKEKGKES
ncbi:MAG: DUF1540 domain-containing protein [Bacillota bacterium]